MKLQSQVCTLEQAKRLKELGIIQQSYFAHFCPCETGLKWLSNSESFVGVKAERKTYYHTTKKDEESLIEQHIYSAFNVAELGVMLPNELDLSDGNYFFTKKGLLHTYEEVTGVILKEWQGTELEAIRRAEILIDLLENNLTTPEEVNTRLIQS
jgi:hypothetical protein